MTAAHVRTPAGEDAELVALVGGYLRVGAGAPAIVNETEAAAYQAADERRQSGRRSGERRVCERRVVAGRRRRDVVTLQEDLEIAVLYGRIRQQQGRRSPPNGVRT